MVLQFISSRGLHVTHRRWSRCPANAPKHRHSRHPRNTPTAPITGHSNPRIHHSAIRTAIFHVAFRNVDPSGAKHRPAQPQEQQQILPQPRRQLQTIGARLGWDGEHHGELERENDKYWHHGAARVQQEVCRGRRWRMWEDVLVDQL